MSHSPTQNSNGLARFVIGALDRRFRVFPVQRTSLYPSDEFDEQEARLLMAMCDRLRSDGYSWIVHESTEPRCRELLDLAAGYGSFVSWENGFSYLGLFIVSELIMDPFAAESFGPEMIRSEVFREVDRLIQDAALILMFLSIIGWRHESVGLRINLLRHALRTKFNRGIEDLEAQDAMAWLTAPLKE